MNKITTTIRLHGIYAVTFADYKGCEQVLVRERPYRLH